MCGEVRIGSMSEDSKAARESMSCWDMERRALLTMYRWNFAKGRAVLAASSTRPLMGFSYQSPVPADFLGLIATWEDNEFQQQYTDTVQPYVTENTANQRVIMSNSNPLYITYRKNVTDTSQFDPLFDKLLACHIALQLQYPLSLSVERTQQIAVELKRWENKAKFSNAIENTPEIVISSQWVDSRIQGDTMLRRGPIG